MTTILKPETAAIADLGETWEEVAARKRGSKAFSEELHPRDSEGQFTETTGGGSSEAWAEGLSEEQQEALLSYGTNGYHAINSLLRGGEETVASDFETNQGYRPNDLAEIVQTAEGRIAEIDAAFASVPPFEADAVSYRGLVLPAGFVPTVGASFTDDAYVSTSDNPDSAEEFSTYYLDEAAGGGMRNGLPPERIVRAEITVPAGTKAIEMNEVWKASVGGGDFSRVEAEKLLDRGSTFTVTDVSTDSLGRYQLKIRVGP